MELSPDTIRELQALYRARFGVELSEEDARTMASELIDLVKLLYRLD